MNIKRDLRQELWSATWEYVLDNGDRITGNIPTISLYNSIRNSFQDSIGDAGRYNNLAAHIKEYGY
jgi:hypothetical protein